MAEAARRTSRPSPPRRDIKHRRSGMSAHLHADLIRNIDLSRVSEWGRVSVPGCERMPAS